MLSDVAHLSTATEGAGWEAELLRTGGDNQRAFRWACVSLFRAVYGDPPSRGVGVGVIGVQLLLHIVLHHHHEIHSVPKPPAPARPANGEIHLIEGKNYLRLSVTFITNVKALFILRQVVAPASCTSQTTPCHRAFGPLRCKLNNLKLPRFLIFLQFLFHFFST